MPTQSNIRECLHVWIDAPNGIVYCAQCGKDRPEPKVNLYSEAIKWAMEHNQTVGEKNDYYITIAQLERFIEMYL